jgi:predicted outer membrane protein
MRTRALTALALLTVAVAGCASAHESPTEWRTISSGHSAGGVADIPAAPRPDAPKTLSESDSRGVVFLAWLAALFGRSSQ